MLASIKADHQERMAAKLATFRPPFPQFDVGDAIELTVSSGLLRTIHIAPPTNLYSMVKQLEMLVPAPFAGLL